MVLFAGKLYKRVSLFTLSLVLAISGLGVAAPLYFSQIAHAVDLVGTVFIDLNTNGVFDSGDLTFSTIQAAIDDPATVAGDTILVSGTFGGIDVYTVYNVTKAITIRGVNTGSDKAKVFGTFLIGVDGATIDNLSITNKGISHPDKNAINLLGKQVTITNNDFNLGNGTSGVANGVVIWPYGNNAVSLNITGNTFTGYDLTVPDWSSTALLIAEEIHATPFAGAPLSTNLVIPNEASFANSNTYINNNYDYVHQNWHDFVGPNAGEWSYSKVSNSAGLSDAIENSTADATILMAGNYTYITTGQIIISKNLTIIGADKATTIIKPAQDTGNLDSGNLKAWFLVNSGAIFNLSNVTLDGSGKLVATGILSYGNGTIENNIIKNIGYNPSTDYYGRGIQLYDTNMTVRNNTLQNIGRIGIFAYGSGVTSALIDGNNYTGKGTNDWLDYGIELGGGAVATISNNTITGNTGVASSDGSTSAGILISTYWGVGTQAIITDNTVTGNTDGIAVGYDALDTSVVTVHNNDLSGNVDTGITSTKPTVNATGNWWGAISGPGIVGSGTGDKVSTNVNYKPFCTDVACINLSSDNPTTTVATVLTSTAATLNGIVGTSNAGSTSFWWGTTSVDSFTSAADPSSQLGGWSYDTDLGSKLASVPFSHNLTGLTPNTSYYFVAWTSVGGTWYPGVVKSFTTVPSIPTNGTPNNSYEKTNDFYFNWDASSDNGIVTYEFQSSLNPVESNGVLTTGIWSSGTLTSNTIHSTGAPDGTWYWQVRAINSIGGKSAWSPIWKMTIDSKVPTVAITAPSVNQVLNGRTVTINGTATDSDFNYYYCYITNANGEVGTRDAKCETAWWAGAPFHNNVFAETANGTANSHLGTITLPNDLSDGNYVVHLVAKDKAGNSAEATQSFILDNTAPNANITSPLVDGYVHRTIDITGTFSDNNHEFNGIYMGFTGNDKTGNQLSWCHSEAPGFGITDGTRTCSFDTTKLSDGSHKIEIWAMDKAGNWGTGSGQSINVMVDNTAPTVILSKPAINSLTGSWTPKVDAGRCNKLSLDCRYI